MTKKKQTTNNDFEELTSLTALIEDEPQKKQGVASKKKSLQPQVASMKEEEKLNPKTSKEKKQTPKQTKKKTASKNPRKQKRYTNAMVGETSSKVMTSIIISEDIRDWLRLKSITSKQSMSQQIEELVKKEMKKTKSI